ncbi:MAG: heavy-metal-associated domain-containing protein [Betaproteobacteria bacterium]|nr:heavy-metal-associated domain-containing protein [Betaproteobacteria bacterium]
MKTEIYRIEGMHCEGCAQTIEALLGQMPGVKRVAVSFGAREARVELDAEIGDDASIVAAIERVGFRAEVLPR